MFGLEPWHIVLLLGVILVVFGPKRLPEIGKSLGASISEFRKATSELPASVRSGAAAPDAATPSPRQQRRRRLPSRARARAARADTVGSLGSRLT
jgi:sec-independent protein translocase protein TatA